MMLIAADVPDPTIFTPFLQYGFAGFCLALLGVIVWLVAQLLGVLKETNKVVAGNTDAINNVHQTAGETRATLADIRDRLLQRPCLVPNKEH